MDEQEQAEPYRRRSRKPSRNSEPTIPNDETARTPAAMIIASVGSWF